MSVSEPKPASSIRRLIPQSKLPSSDALRSLSDSDIRLLKRRLLEPAECVFDPAFQQTDAERAHMQFGSRSNDDSNGGLSSDDSGINWIAIPLSRAMTGAEEKRMFLRLNYCRSRVMHVLREFRGKALTAAAALELVRWERWTRETRSEIVRANVPLVLAMAKRTKITSVDHADLISEGNLALLRSVDKFDCSRGFKFSTYACRAILKSFSRVASRTARYRGYFPTEFDPTLEKSNHVEQRRRGLEDDCVNELKAILGTNMAQLNDIEQCVIRARFAIESEAGEDQPRAKTLEQVGEMIGVTKERVRQIQNKALSKLRSVLEDGVLSA